MNTLNSKFVLFSLSLSSAFVFGQIKEEKLVLERKKTPNVKRVEKKKTAVPILKNYPPEEKSEEKIEYNITNIPLVSDFKTSQIKGEDMAPSMITEEYTNYARIGMGNYARIVADGSFNHRLSDKFDLVTKLDFNSTAGLEKEYAWKSNARRLNLEGGVNGYFDSGKYNVNLKTVSDQYNYYGIYAMNPSSNIGIRQNVNQVSLQTHYDHYSNNILNAVKLETGFLSDNYSASESTIQLETNLSKHAISINNNDISLNIDAGLGLNLVSNSFDLYSQIQNNYLHAYVEPKFTFYKGKSKVMIGSNFSVLNGNTKANANEEKTNKTLWFPQFEANIEADPTVRFILGIKGGLQHNSYGSLLQQVPYLISNQVTRPSEEKYHLYFGIAGDISQKLSYSLKAGIAKVNHIAHFGANNLFDTQEVTNRAGFDYANTFTTLYSNGTINQFHGTIAFVPLQNLTLKGDIQYFDYKLQNDEKILNRPNVKASFGGQYIFLNKKLMLGAKGFVVGSRNTQSYSFTPNLGTYTVTETIEKLPGYFDINLSAEYEVHKNFSIFVMGDNLLNKNYETFIGYRVLGAQVLGGFKVRF